VLIAPKSVGKGMTDQFRPTSNVASIQKALQKLTIARTKPALGVLLKLRELMSKQKNAK